MRPLIALLPLVVAAACSTFSSGDVSPEPQADASPPDATVASPEDAGADSSDGWVPCKDRQLDATTQFCEDFDRTGTIAFGWNPDLNSGGAYAETDAASSPPRALATTIPATSTGAAYVALRHDLGASMDFSKAKKATIAFSVRVPAAPFPADGGSYVHVFGIELDDNTACDAGGSGRGRQLTVTFFPSPTRLDVVTTGLDGVACGVNDFHAEALPFDGSNITTAGYIRVELELSRVSCKNVPGAALRTTVAGTPVPCIDFGMGQPLDVAKRFQLVLGLITGGGAKASEADYDDITVDLE